MSIAAAGAGASNAIREILKRRFLEQQEAARVQQEQIQNRQREQQIALQGQREARELAGQKADIADRTAQRALQGEDREIAATGRRRAENERDVMQLMGAGLQQIEGSTKPNRNQIMGMLTEIGKPPTAELLKDPEAERVAGLKDYEDKAKIAAKYRSTGSDDVVPVQTMENGKRVTKYLPKSQVRGQTFESPSGGPTLATGQARRVLNFYSRMKEASETIEGIEPEIAKQSTPAKYQGQYAPNILQSPLQQSYRQAQRAFTEARLRKESGAAIPPHEYENDAKTYFAQPGDDANTLAQKKQKRAALMEATAFEAGPAYEEYYGEPFKRGGAAPDDTDALLDELLGGR